jgi:hypothetical protein
LTESCILDALNEHGVTFRDRLFNPATPGRTTGLAPSAAAR